MTKRLQIIFDELPKCKTFADIGCDHGYIAKAMLNSGKCEKAIVSDISQKCLDKAVLLLESEIKSGKAQAVLSDGFTNLPDVDTALIAGMGGEEIIKILREAKNLPDRLVLQPMKNFDRVRIYCNSIGYKIERDFIFYQENKYYVLISLVRGSDNLTPTEIEFGRTNLTLKSEDFISYINSELNKVNGYLTAKNISEEEKSRLIERKEKLIQCLN